MRFQILFKYWIKVHLSSMQASIFFDISYNSTLQRSTIIIDGQQPITIHARSNIDAHRICKIEEGEDKLDSDDVAFCSLEKKSVDEMKKKLCDVETTEKEDRSE
ncbi:unnamed protein product [Vicia faba]|uniref:Uncharacterized protein n=1 Tax=Vicia faba TaxID=3906 RepID=A0AAV0ZM98_VICFA|nr:unnamed protein product [Vicia faba]